MQQILRIPLEGLDLLLPQSLLIANHILLALELPMLSTVQSLLGTLHRFVLALHRMFLGHLLRRLLLVHHIVGVVINILLLLYFVRMVHHHICFEIKFRCIQLEIFSLLHTLLQLPLPLVLEVADNRVREKILPLDSLVGIDSEHPPDDILCHLRDVVDIPGEPQRLVLDVVDQIDHIGCLVGRAAYNQRYNPNRV